MTDSIIAQINEFIFRVIEKSDESNAYREIRVLKELAKISNLVAQNKYTEASDAIHILLGSYDGQSVFTATTARQLAQVSGRCGARAKFAA